MFRLGVKIAPNNLLLLLLLGLILLIVHNKYQTSKLQQIRQHPPSVPVSSRLLGTAVATVYKNIQLNTLRKQNEAIWLNPKYAAACFIFFSQKKILQVSRKLSHDDASSEKSCLVSFLPQKNCFQIFPIFTETLFSHLFQEDKKAASLKFFLFWRECEDVSQLKLGVQSWKVHINF